MGATRFADVKQYMLGLQDRICAALEEVDGGARFREERFEGPGGPVARPRVLEEGEVLEKAAVHFTHARGGRLPPVGNTVDPKTASWTNTIGRNCLVYNPALRPARSNTKWNEL